MPRCLQIHAADNVATLLEDASAGRADVVGGTAAVAIDLCEPIALGHKVALRAIALDAPIVKYGVTIAIATRAIAPGEWVHLQNCKSLVDERSQTLDLKTGAPKDNVYE